MEKLLVDRLAAGVKQVKSIKSGLDNRIFSVIEAISGQRGFQRKSHTTYMLIAQSTSRSLLIKTLAEEFKPLLCRNINLRIEICH